MSKTYQYTLESLESLFADHAEMVWKERERDLAKFMKDYPGTEIPGHLKNDFNLSQALHVIVRELNELKSRCKG